MPRRVPHHPTSFSPRVSKPVRHCIVDRAIHMPKTLPMASATDKFVQNKMSVEVIRQYAGPVQVTRRVWVRVPGKHFPGLQATEQKEFFKGTAVESKDKHKFHRHLKAWGAEHTGGPVSGTTCRVLSSLYCSPACTAGPRCRSQSGVSRTSLLSCRVLSDVTWSDVYGVTVEWCHMEYIHLAMSHYLVHVWTSI